MRERMNMTRRCLRERDITALQRSIICTLASGGTMYAAGTRRWLSTAFEAGVPAASFWSLLAKKLIKRCGRLPGQAQFILTDKGREWAAREWRP